MSRHPCSRALLCLVLLLPVLTAARPAHAAQPRASGTIPVHGGVLVDGLLADPDQLLPNFSRRYYTLLVQQALFAPLFYSDDRGIIHPGLAGAVPTVANGGISADGRVYTFHLRRGLRWSDGTPLTARDVDFSWRLWTNPRLASVVASSLGFDHILRTTISLDALSITFHLVQPYAPFLSAWTDAPGPLPAHTLGLISAERLLDSGIALAPDVNSGPFTLSPAHLKPGVPQPEIRTGSQIVVVRNPFYYRARQGYPYLDAIVFRTLRSQGQLLDALRSHTVDCAWLLPITDFAALLRIRGVRVLPLQDANWEAAIINMRRPAFQDVRVRRALQLGLDRGAMVRTTWHGLASLIGSDQPPASPVYDRSVAPYDYDPALAGRLLDAAGWRLRGDGFRHRGKSILSFTYSTTFNNPWRQADEAQVLNSYERLGIQVVIRNYPPSVFLQQVLPNGTFDLAEYVFNNALDPDNIATFGSGFAPPQGANYGRYRNPAFDALAAQELSTPDPEQRSAIFRRMQRLLHDDAPDIWLYSPYDIAAVSTRLHNYRPSPFSQDTWNAGEWWLTPPATHAAKTR